ncbi:hypothetical protein EON73_00085 [bacterium]|nr:MAG: hypothetical protein EON73_00085 [bacterium]
MNATSIFFNKSFDKKKLKAFIYWVLKTFGEKKALTIIEELKSMGFSNATKAGLSIGLHDLKTPSNKKILISRAQIIMNKTDREFQGAELTATERSQRIIDTWHRTSEDLRKQVVDYFSTYDQLNSVYMMALSGARGNFSQVRQLIGMRGLMADPQGQIISFPIRSNLREGLTLTEYFISCSGARKGLVDTALRTADTGYLTRRLVDISHHIVVKKVTCYTSRGIALKALQSSQKVLLPLKDRLVGRVLGENIYSSKYSESSSDILSRSRIYSKSEDEVCDKSSILIAKKNQEISPELALRISLVKMSKMKINYTRNKVGTKFAKYEDIRACKAKLRVQKQSWSKIEGYPKPSVLEGRKHRKQNFKNPDQNFYAKRYQAYTKVTKLDKLGSSFAIRRKSFVKSIQLAYGDKGERSKLPERNFLPRGENGRHATPLLAKNLVLEAQVLVRSPLTCAYTHEVCQLCYGWSMAQGSLVSLGEAVGVIAGQSIGEPGTQLTMRTFHTGGVFSGDLLQEIRAPHSGKILFPKALQGLLIRTSQGRIAFLTKVSGELLVDTDNMTEDEGLDREEMRKTTRLLLEPSTILFVRQGEKVKNNQILAELAITSEEGNQPIKSRQTLFSEMSGKVVQWKSLLSKMHRTKGVSKGQNGGEDSPLFLLKYDYKGRTTSFDCKTSFSKSEEWDNGNDLTLKKIVQAKKHGFGSIEPPKALKLGLLSVIATRIGASEKTVTKLATRRQTPEQNSWQKNKSLKKVYNLSHLNTIAKEGDLVDENYSKI